MIVDDIPKPFQIEAVEVRVRSHLQCQNSRSLSRPGCGTG